MNVLDTPGAFGVTPGTPNAANASTATGERFLKLLVAQMQNQDPLNPLDNAQVTSQLAQINTVNGIEAVNTNLQAMTGRLLQLQTLQGASLVGRDVTIAGNGLAVQGGSGVGGFELLGAADRVQIEILSPAGQVVDTLDLGSLAFGRHAFEWPADKLPDGAPYAFRVVATNGAAPVPVTPLMRDRVEAVRTVGDQLLLETTRIGTVPYGQVLAFN
jgi:flagellar basal-body rod modification protein FlgD